MAMSNPYEIDPASLLKTQQNQDSISHMSLVVWWIGMLYPVLATCPVYLTWLLAWVFLGHRPQPSVDDPLSINALMDCVHFASILLSVPFPMLSLFGLLAAVQCPIASIRQSRIKLAVIICSYILMYVGVMAWVRSDPGQVFMWWLD